MQICIVRLRKALSHAAIQTSRDGGYRLAMVQVSVDADRLEELIARGRGFLTTGEPDRAATALARALALVRGEPYRAIEHWPPAAAEAERLTEVIRSAEDDLLDARLVLGQHREIVGEATALVAQDPLRERRWAVLALAQYRCGRQADALESVHRARVLLREQLGIDPGAELLDLEQRILHQDASLDEIAEPRPVSTACPYKGLAPLSAGDQLFGRDTEVAELLERSDDDWTPGRSPARPDRGSRRSYELGSSRRSNSRGAPCRVVVPDPRGAIDVPDGSEPSTVLVIDQFEHALQGDRPAETVRSDLSALARYATSTGLVIIVVRADQLAALGIAPAIGRLAEQNLHFVTAPTGPALREAIERPAVEAGLRVEPGLVDLVMRDTEGEPGALPMMSHALAETWQRRDGNVLTVEAYRASGGIRGAVARTADRRVRESGGTAAPRRPVGVVAACRPVDGRAADALTAGARARWARTRNGKRSSRDSSPPDSSPPRTARSRSPTRHSRVRGRGSDPGSTRMPLASASSGTSLQRPTDGRASGGRTVSSIAVLACRQPRSIWRSLHLTSPWSSSTSSRHRHPVRYPSGTRCVRTRGASQGRTGVFASFSLRPPVCCS